MMKKVIEYLEAKGIEYEETSYGDSYRYGVSVDGINVFFNCDYEESMDDMEDFVNFMHRMAGLVTKVEFGDFYYCFQIMTAADNDRLEAAIKENEKEKEMIRELHENLVYLDSLYDLEAGIESRWEQDPENEDFENQLDEIYTERCEAFNACVILWRKISGIDCLTARKMIAEEREELITMTE